MRVVVDSSAFAKRYILEAGSERLDAILTNASDLALCIIVVPELLSALNRRLREGNVTKKDYQTIKQLVLEDVHDVTVVQLTPAVIALSVKLLENNVLRAMDALHVACALEWKADLFVTSDKKQGEAAMRSGLDVEYLGQQHSGSTF
ncbi:type II toxin-antitoxin system VapC family toxin [Desulfobulbus propionicus]|jgi:predicted nucleic acid-binding protein